MAFNVSALTTYTDQQQYPLVHRTVLENRISKLVRIQAGVRTQVAINIMSTDLQWQAQSCAGASVYQGSGSLTLSQRTLVPGLIQAGETFCIADIEKYYLAYQLKPGSYQEEIPFEAEFTNFYASAIAEQAEISLFNGDTTSTTNNLSLFDGWIKNVSASLGNGLGTTGGGTGYFSGSFHYSASSGSPITSSNVNNVILGVYNAIPTALLQSTEKPVIMVGWDVFNTYVQYLASIYPLAILNQPNDVANGIVTIPFTAVKVMAFGGLNSVYNTKYAILAGQPSNFVQGVALEDDISSFKMVYNPYSDQVQMKAKFVLAANVAKPTEIVYAFNGQ